MKKYETISLRQHIAGQAKDYSSIEHMLSTVKLAGEDLAEDRMLVQLIDFPDWIEHDWKMYLGIERSEVEKLIKALQKHLENNKGKIV